MFLKSASSLYRFRLIDQAGTYFYHAHVGLQDDFIKGPLVVYEDSEANVEEVRVKDKKKQLKAGPYKYDDELLLQMGEAIWIDTLFGYCEVVVT